MEKEGPDALEVAKKENEEGKAQEKAQEEIKLVLFSFLILTT